MQRLALSLFLIVFGLSFGYVLQHLVASGRVRLPMEVSALRKGLQKIGLLGCMAGSFFLAVWIIRIPDPRLAAIPVIGVATLAMGGVLGLAASRILGHDRNKAGAMFCAGSFTNIGAIGALTAILFLGEQGFALVALYKLLEETYYYAIGFPIAKYHGADDAKGEGLAARLKAVFTDVFVVTILGAVLLGGALNAAGVPRPEVLGMVSTVLVPVGTVLLLISIGLAMRFGRIRSYARECGAIMLIKFVFAPLMAVGAAALLGYGDIQDGLPLKAVLICSTMPVAFNALIPPSLYDLDLDLANSCWLATTLGLLAVLPLLHLFLSWA